VRREVRIGRPAADVWELVGDPSRLPEWFPGIVAATVDGSTRVVTLGSGMTMPEEIVTCDPLTKRFQYRMTGPLVTEHLSTIDVFDLGDGSCLVSYACDAAPATVALLIGGAGGNALHALREMLEAERPKSDTEGAT
jgi:uncharacterized protein YndB with AHSA1/START domain